MMVLAPRFWTFPVWLTLCLATGCAPATPASVPGGPPAEIAVRVDFFLPVLGTWLVDGFSETLRDELAKYDVAVVPDRASPEVTAFIRLGDWSDRLGTGRAFIISLVRQGRVIRVGHVWVPDLSRNVLESPGHVWVPDVPMSTLNVAAEEVAVVIVRLLRTSPEPSQSTAAR